MRVSSWRVENTEGPIETPDGFEVWLSGELRREQGDPPEQGVLAFIYPDRAAAEDALELFTQAIELQNASEEHPYG